MLVFFCLNYVTDYLATADIHMHFPDKCVILFVLLLLTGLICAVCVGSGFQCHPWLHVLSLKASFDCTLWRVVFSALFMAYNLFLLLTRLCCSFLLLFSR